jgi:hypothetical protein
VLEYIVISLDQLAKESVAELGFESIVDHNTIAMFLGLYLEQIKFRSLSNKLLRLYN